MDFVTCSSCGKEFNFNPNVDSNLANAVGRGFNKTCYNCTLAHLTGGRVPEESDFTSAFLISGEISDQELKSLMDDLQAIEVGRSIQETYKEEDEDINSMWDDYCPKCYESLMACECGYVVRCSRCHEPASQCVCDENV